MKNAIKLILVFSFVLISCKKETIYSSFWDKCEIVATKELVNGDTIIICDANAVSKTFNIPLEMLVDSFRVLKLDNKTEEGIIGRSVTPVAYSKNFFGVYCFGYFPLKLFNSQGVFLRSIGSLGQGPGEFIVISDVQIDEVNDRVYISTWMSDKILVYDLKGNLKPSISLPSKVMRARFRVNFKKKEVLVLCVTLENTSSQVWLQDFEGNLIQTTSTISRFSDQLPVEEFIVSGLHTDNVDLFRQHYFNSDELLYHYDLKLNKLLPKFKMKNINNSVFIYELPRYYIIETAHSTGPNSNEPESKKIIVDKTSLRGCYFNNFITPIGIPLGNYNMLGHMKDGIFSLVEFGSEIEKHINHVDESRLTSDNRKLLIKLKHMIEEEADDCSLLFVGKFKQ